MPPLLLLVVSLLVIIAGPVVCLRCETSKLQKSYEYPVRYVNSNLELKNQVPSLEELYPFNPPEITSKEFTKVINTMLKRIMYLLFFALFALPVAGQDRVQTTTETRTEVQTTFAPKVKNEFSLRANLLRWATLTPDLGVEWRINSRWGMLANGSWTSWSWDNKNRRYALWNISPAIHYYIGMQKCGYVGAMFQTGEFNYKFSETGKQGNYYGGGVTGGYLLRLNRSLLLDLSLGLGCTHAEYDKYAVIDNVRVKRGKENKNYWGVNRAGITLVWQLK